MGSRLSNYPLNVIYDRAPNQVLSMSGSDALQTITNTPQDMIDFNTSTFYQVGAYNNSGAPNTVVLTIDYGRVYWSCNLSLLCWLGGAGGFNFASSIDYSTDGATWTNLLLNTYGDIELKDYFTNFRYLRITMQQGTYGPLVEARIKIYEHHLTGAG